MYHNAEIGRFRATPKDETEDMQVNPEAHFVVSIEKGGHASLDSLLDAIHWYIRFGIVEAYFTHGLFPDGTRG